MAQKTAARHKSGSFRETLQRARKRWYFYVGISGTLALLIVFYYYPAFSAFYHAFTVWDGFAPARWVGLANFKEIFTQSEYQQAFGNMFLLGGWQVVRAIVFPLLGAALLYRLRSERKAYFFRLLFVLPIVVPGVVTVKVWQQFFAPTGGLFNAILHVVGIAPLAWLNSPQTALSSLMLVGFPWIDGVNVLIFLAGLLNIPLEIVEAAVVDGCGSWRRFFAIELPLIVPQIRLVAILSVIHAFQSFGWQFLVTAGGPVGATNVPAYQMYYSAMTLARYGVASAIGVVLFIMIFVLTLINRAAIQSDIEFAAH